MKYLFVGSLIWLSVFSCGQNQPPINDQFDAIDQLFREWDNDQSPGAAIGIIHNGQLIYSKAYGLANLEHNLSNTPNTAFNIASNSKQFTAACISILVLRGELDMTQTLDLFFPEFPDYAKKITIRHLLHHTSGLRDFSQITYLSGLRPDDYYNDQDILNWIRSQQQLNFEPGEKHLYSNSGYWLLGQIVQKVSEMPLADFAQKELFEPLNMADTQFYDDNTLVIKNRASGYSRNRNGGFRHIYSMLEHTGNGGIYSTVNDLKKWDDEYYNQRVLSQEFWDLMTTQGSLNNGETISYAQGLAIGEHGGLPTVDHGGRAPGYLSNILRFPEEKLTIILLSNSSNLDARRMSYSISDILLQQKLQKEEPRPFDTSKVVSLTHEQLKKLTGSYWSQQNSISRKIILTNDTLRYERSRRSSHVLLPFSSTEFKMMGTPEGMDVRVKFQNIDSSPIMKFIENGKEVDTWDAFQPISYSSQELTPFSGRYYSEEIDTYYELKVEGENQMLLLINGDPTVPLRPVKENLFSSPMGIFRFSRDHDTSITDLQVSTPRVKNLTFLKSMN